MARYTLAHKAIIKIIPATDYWCMCTCSIHPHAPHRSSYITLCVCVCVCVFVFSDLFICDTPYAGVLWWALSVQTITIQSGPETVSKLASQSQWRLWHFISRIVCTFSQTLSLHVHAVWYRSSILHRKSVCNGELLYAKAFCTACNTSSQQWWHCLWATSVHMACIKF